MLQVHINHNCVLYFFVYIVQLSTLQYIQTSIITDDSSMTVILYNSKSSWTYAWVQQPLELSIKVPRLWYNLCQMQNGEIFYAYSVISINTTKHPLKHQHEYTERNKCYAENHFFFFHRIQ